jgi:hypothetical protein
MPVSQAPALVEVNALRNAVRMNNKLGSYLLPVCGIRFSGCVSDKLKQ